jgi:PqqD family protein of HPr-rel-A system
MRVADTVYVEWVEGEAVVLDQSSGELHYLNATAALVLALIQEHGYDAAVDEVHARFGTGDDVTTGLRDLVEEMREKRLLVDD